MKDLYDLRVVKVLNDYDIVVNAGYVDDVSDRMTFLVFELGEEIFDPETHESLGQLEQVRGTIRVHHLQEKMFVGRSNSSETVRTSPTSIIASINRQETERKILKRLNDVKEGDRIRRIS